MGWLQILLFGLGAIGCVAAYWWGVQPRRRSNRLIHSPHWRRSRRDAPEVGDLVLHNDGGEEVTDEVTDDVVGVPGAEAEADLPIAADDVEPAANRVIAIHLAAPEGTSYAGPHIRTAAEAVGFRFAESGVFHHYGVGQLQSRNSIFCLANMFEPGSFDLDDLPSCQTKGLVLLMPLPLPLDGKVAFELFLNSAHRLSRKLGGELSDERRQPLTPENVHRLRTMASAYAGTAANSA